MGNNIDFKKKIEEFTRKMDSILFTALVTVCERDRGPLDLILKNRLKESVNGSAEKINKTIEKQYKRKASDKELNRAYATVLTKQIDRSLKSIGLTNHSWRKEVAKKLTRSPGLNEYVETYIKFLDYKTEIEKGVVSN